MPVKHKAPASPELPPVGRELLGAKVVSQAYGATQILTDIEISIRAGEILALVGENGAGKSTLMKVLSGQIPHGRFEGETRVNGEPKAFSNVHEAERSGIVLIPQELRIAPLLPIAENMFIGHLPAGKLGIVDYDALEERASKWLEVFDLDVLPFEATGRLSTSEQRMAMIAGALSKDANVLLLDEPTAALTDAETQQLFRHVLRLRDQGMGIVFITHRLDEVEQIADRVAVMRNGRMVGQLETAKQRRREIVRLMIGRDLETVPRRTPHPGHERDTVLEVRSLVVEDPDVAGKLRVDGIDLTLRRGEVHGIYGLIGAGRTELARALFGDWRGRISGDCHILGRRGIPRSPRQALDLGIAMLTEDRKATGIIEGHSLATNFSAASLGGVSRYGLIAHNREYNRNRAMIKRLDVRPPDLQRHIESLSGGNQQKVLIGRWLNTDPKILILDEPTLGVDVGARFQIYQTISALAEEGLAVLLISSDVDEVLAECDRITVMYKGRKVHEFQEARSREELVAAATGALHVH